MQMYIYKFVDKWNSIVYKYEKFYDEFCLTLTIDLVKIIH